MRFPLQRPFFILLAVAVALVVTSRPSRSLGIVSQRAQETVYILVNVTGIAYHPHGAVSTDASGATPIAAHFALRARGSAPSVDADVINGSSVLVAQNQGSVQVRAEVTPNPNATLLVVNQTNETFNATAGTTISQKCIYTVTSNAAAIASWTIKQGLANDFTSTWSGSDLANNSYLQSGTPKPSATPFTVYPSNWTPMASSGNAKTYCVDLTLTIPASVPTGAYSTTAVYSLWY